MPALDPALRPEAPARDLAASPTASPGADAGRPTAVPDLVSIHVELAALHQAFIEHQTSLHIRVLRLIAPELRP